MSTDPQKPFNPNDPTTWPVPQKPFDSSDPNTWPIVECVSMDVHLGTFITDCSQQMTPAQRDWPVVECEVLDVFHGVWTYDCKAKRPVEEPKPQQGEPESGTGTFET